MLTPASVIRPSLSEWGLAVMLYKVSQIPSINT